MVHSRLGVGDAHPHHQIGGLPVDVHSCGGDFQRADLGRVVVHVGVDHREVCTQSAGGEIRHLERQAIVGLIRQVEALQVPCTRLRIPRHHQVGSVGSIPF